MGHSAFEAVRSFCEQLKTNHDLRMAMRHADTEESAVAIAKDFGFEFTAQDVRDAIADMMTDDELSAVSAAGGSTEIDYSKDPMAYWGTPQYREYFIGLPDDGGGRNRPRFGQ